MPRPLIVVMGVSGCGKSTVGAMLAETCGVPYLEGDSVHSQANVARMRAGVALTDDDRREWLELLSQRIAQARAQATGLVVSCSALKRQYRDVLRRGASDLTFVHLQGERALLAQRTASRPGHYMPASLLDSQLATLQAPGPDENAQTFDISQAPQDIVSQVAASLARAA